MGDAGSVTLYVSRDDTGNWSLWRTDGTASGTAKIPMPASVTQFGSHGVELNGQLYFLASSGLWKTDGTAAGTVLVAPPYVRITGNNDPLTKVGNTLYFNATNNLAFQLWKSDGTPVGTVMVNENSTGVDPYNFTVANGLLYYTAWKTESFPSGGSLEVWRSDGTAAGTFPLTKFNTTGPPIPTDLMAAGDVLYFRSWTDGDLYVTDGTVEGTRLVKSFASIASESTGPWPTGALGTSAIFTAEGGTGRDLWVSDGSEEGTALVYEPQDAMDSNIGGLINVGDKWFFHADDGVHGREPWVSDGTPEGTFMLKDIWPGSDGFIAEGATFTAFKGKVYFAAKSLPHGIELWESDGTQAGTRLFKDIEPGAGWSSPDGLVSSNGKLFFTASTSANSREMWVSDGTEAGTRMIVDLFQDAYAHPFTLAAVNGEVYFYCTTSQVLFYKSDGTAEGTVLLGQFPENVAGFSTGSTAELNGTLLFSHYALWKTDGTPEGTAHVRGFGPFGYPHELTVLGEYAYFLAHDESFHERLWRTDGTTAGTVIVAGINLGGGELVVSNGRLYFNGESEGLWSYNPVNGATNRVHHLRASGAAAVADGLLYGANDGIHGLELWKSNGTPGRTQMVQDIFPGGSSDPEQITPGAERVLFTAETDEHGRELWALEIEDLTPAAAESWELYE